MHHETTHYRRLAAVLAAAPAIAGDGWDWRAEAAAFGLLPLVNALTTDRHLAASLPAGDWVFAGFDLAMLAIGLVFTAVAWRLNRKARFVRREPDALPARAPRKQVGVAE